MRDEPRADFAVSLASLADGLILLAFWRVCWLGGWLAAYLLTGCAPPPLPQPPPVEAPAPTPPAPPAASPAATARVKHDTAAVQQRAQAFLAPPSTSAAAVASLEPLTRAVNRSLAVMELHHKRDGRYRPADVAAARAAGEAVTRFLNQQSAPAPEATP